MAIGVDFAPTPGDRRLGAPRQSLPRGAVAHPGDRHHLIRHSAPVRVVHVPEEPRVVVLRQRGHQALAERRLELVFLGTDDAVHLVHEQHELLLSLAYARRDHLDELSTHDLAGLAVGQAVDEHDVLGNLVDGQALLAVRPHSSRHRGRGHDGDAHTLAHLRVGNPGGGDVGDGGMRRGAHSRSRSARTSPRRG